MHHAALLLTLTIGATALAQNSYIPDASPTVGSCNTVPFGSTAGSTSANTVFQTRCTAMDLGNAAGLVTGLAFAACSTGRTHYDALTIKLAHIPAAQALSATFASNLAGNAIVVLQAFDYTWHITANMWNEVGLQHPFAYNGVDDLLIEITTINGEAPAGMRRGNRERVYWSGFMGPAPTTGTIDLLASKVEVSMGTAHTSLHGDGCVGSNGVAPQHGFAGAARVGQSLSFLVSGAVANGLALLVVGDTNGAPFPFDLALLGMPGCDAYTNFVNALVVGLDATGAGGYVLNIPATIQPGLLFYTQFACLDSGANVLGLTTSSYGRVLVGL